MNKLLITFTFLLLTSWSICYGQEFSKSSLKYATGIGASMGKNAEGLGLVFSVGYQREIWKDRLRLNPNMSFGYYSGKGISDAPDVYFNSVSLQTNLYVDAVRFKAFSLVLGTGALVNNSRG
ncbi:hypothetical protein GCM10028895_34930 [Pontibacter rugosus]